MHIPDITIECLRCTESAPLTANAVQLDTAGVWRPVNARRPDNWIAWPDSHFDLTTGICPRCAPEWSRHLARFLSTFSADASITLRNPPPPEEEPRRANSIPIPAAPISAAQFVPVGAAPTNAQRHTRVQNATIQSTLPTFAAPPVSHSTVMASPIPNATVHATPISTRNQAVKVEAIASVKIAAPVTAHRIAIPASAPIIAAPISTPIPHSSSPTNSKIVEISDPVPIEPPRDSAA